MARDITDQGWILLRRSASRRLGVSPFTSPEPDSPPYRYVCTLCRETLSEIDGGLRTYAGSWKLRRCQFLELSRRSGRALGDEHELTTWAIRGFSHIQHAVALGDQA